VIVSPGAGSSVPGTFTVQGTGEKLAAVEVREGASTLATTTVGTNGLWTVTLTLSDGPHGIQARQTDVAGNTGPLSPVRSIIVDATPPGPPTITDPLEGSVNTASVLVRGTSTDPNGTITIYDGANVVGVTIASGTGAWQKQIVFDDGGHSITAQEKDVAGNVGSASSARNFTTDGTPPQTTISPVTGNLVGAVSSSIVVTLATPPLTGYYDDTISGSHFSSGVNRVMVTFTSVLTNSVVQSGLATCSPVCGSGSGSGTWSYTPTPLLPGLYKVDVVAVDEAGNIQSPPAEITLITAGG
jgi:hypothetical protein